MTCYTRNETSLSDFVVTMHSGICEQYIQLLSLYPQDWDLLFACVWVHCDKTLKNQTSLNLLNIWGIDIQAPQCHKNALNWSRFSVANTNKINFGNLLNLMPRIKNLYLFP